MTIERSRQLYRRNAPVYDVMALPFGAIRRAALSLLAPQPGEVIVDLACGTGLSFAPLVRAVGSRGRVIGIDGSPDMLSRARRRIARHEWSNVATVLADAESLALEGVTADAVLCCLSHDVMSSVAAMRGAARLLRKGGRFVAAGVKLATGPLAGIWNALVRATAGAGVTVPFTERPWSALESVLEPLEVRLLGGGTAYVARGRHY